MPRSAFRIDEVRAKQPEKKGWEDLRYDAFVLADKLTLIDETENFSEFGFQVRDNVRYQTHYPGRIEFELLRFFGEPRLRADVERFFVEELPVLVGDEVPIDEALAAYMDRLVGLCLIRPTNEVNDKIAQQRHKLEWSKEDRPIFFKAPSLQRHDKQVRSFPVSVGINLTERCNLACLHCCVGSNPHVSTKNDLSTDELSRVFDQLEEGGVESVRLTGGEPMIRPDFWEIFEDALSRRFTVVLYTNGTRINEDNIDKFIDAKTRKGSRFSIHLSLDGGTASTHDFLRNRKGNFDRVVRTMKLLQKHRIHFFVESVLHKGSACAAELDALAEVVRTHGVTWISVHPGEQIGTGESEENIYFTREELVALRGDIEPIIDKWARRGLQINFSSYTFPLDEPKVEEEALEVRAEAEVEITPESADWKKSFQRKYSQSRAAGFNVCTAGTSQMALGADGQAYGCPRYVGAAPYAMGSVRDRELVDIWSSPGWDWLRADYRPKLRLCNSCNFIENCFYGKTCRANPGYLFNDAYGVSPECIREYDVLGIPFQEIVDYLEERIETEREDFRIVSLCERLLSQVRAKEAALQVGRENSVS
ncbi:radical SAM protein [Engelhardtia mirabilis]|uniref:Antilisterial bacteriocin subtilosin biosynthesis protein AlbA n=1 Tax=Engelhardtia mirabilis TaxID=2528011 RepID=A0A518BLB3_9BACT|nr:Antilisterial bacteriocin subtilosin biosynthesis protein AlbA [Planctomycetes bacterium Pla133]QDV02090.1 Antilisterial bacteriocin subtilosin biosynthesis protein AlbA [Planctomycetes bacterium Pla86]